MITFRRKIYDKLVRDKISEHLTSQGLKYEILKYENDYEYQCALRKKLIEETTELVKALEEYDDKATIEEMADLLEICEAIRLERHISLSKLESVKKAKAEKKGKFKDRCHLIWVARSPDDPR